MIPIKNKLPEEGTKVLLYSTDGNFFVGEYIGGGQFATVTDCPLQEDGSFAHRFTHIYKTYFSAWSALEPPFFPTTHAADLPVACDHEWVERPPHNYL